MLTKLHYSLSDGFASGSSRNTRTALITKRQVQLQLSCTVRLRMTVSGTQPDRRIFCYGLHVPSCPCFERVAGIEPAPSAWRAEVIAIRPHSLEGRGWNATAKLRFQPLPLRPECVLREGRNRTLALRAAWDCPSYGHIEARRRQSSMACFVVTPWIEQGTFPASTGRSCQLS